MRIVNKTRRCNVCETAELADTFIKRFRGLMLTRPKNLVIKAKKQSVLDSTIHMMFMLYPLNVVWADDEMTVVDVQRGVQPFHLLKPSTWRMHRPRKPARYIIELVEEPKCRLGDQLEFEAGPSPKDKD